MDASHFPKIGHTKYAAQCAKLLSVQFIATWQFYCLRRSSECEWQDIKTVKSKFSTKQIFWLNCRRS